MKNDLSCLISYLRAQQYDPERCHVEKPKPIITISRLRGAKGTRVAEKLADKLTHMADWQPWVVMNRALIQHVADDLHLSEQVRRLLNEEQAASIQQRIARSLRLPQSPWPALQKLTPTMLQMAQLGNVIFVGGAGHIVLAHQPNAVHVRIIGSLEKRVQRVMEEKGLARGDAESEVRKSDYDRAEFVHGHFGIRSDDALRYHLVINTDLVPVDTAALLIEQLLFATCPHCIDPHMANHLQPSATAVK